MEARTQKEIFHTLVLSNDEASQLKGIMQNPLHGENLENEESKHKEMREIFWDGLNKIGVNVR